MQRFFIVRQFCTSKKPHPRELFKRKVVPSDLDGSKIKKVSQSIPPNFVETKRWNKKELEQWGKHLYKGKYGNSIYEPHILYPVDKKK